MKVKVIPRSPLVSEGQETPALPPIKITDAPQSEKQENLYKAIERTQAFMHKRVSPDNIMAIIRRRFPAPVFFVESNRQVLERMGIPWLDAFYYSMIPSLTRTTLSQQWGPKPSLKKLSLMRDYASTLYVGIHVECFYVIMLDRQGKLIRAAMLQKGGVDNAPFYLGQLLEVALMEEARFIVLVHNHPGGTRRPSKEDLQCTLRALNAFAPLKIPMLDHLIVARETVVSIRETGMIPAILWTAAAPGSRIVSGWLDGNLNNM